MMLNICRKFLQVFILLVLSCGLFSCSDKYKDVQFSPAIEDDSGILSESIQAALLEYDYPPGAMVHIFTENQVDTAQVGIRANALFKELSENADDPKAFKQRGVLFYITADPALIQIRAGNKISYSLLFAGITSGEDYYHLQESIPEIGFDNALYLMVNNTMCGVEYFDNIGWWKRFRINGAIKRVGNLISNYVLPVDNFWSNTFLKPTLRLISTLNIHSWMWTFFLMALLVYVIKWLVQGVVKLMLHRFNFILKVALILTNVLFALSFSLSAGIAAILISGGRMEDRYALKVLNSPFWENFHFGVADHNLQGSLFLVFIFLFIIYLAKVTSHPVVWVYLNQPEDIQKRRFERLEIDNVIYAAYLTSLTSETAKEEIFTKSFIGLNTKASEKIGLIFVAVFIVPPIFLLTYVIFQIPVILQNFWRIWRMKRRESRMWQLKKTVNLGYLGTLFSLLLILLFSLIGQWTHPFKELN